jgi:hypothetical protein
MELISTIAIRRSSRDMLKKLGNKGQTNDEIIRDLIKCKDQDSLDREVGSLQSSESRNPLELVNPMSQDRKPTNVNKNLCEGIGCDREATAVVAVNVGELGIINLNLCENCRPKFKQSIAKENSMLICQKVREDCSLLSSNCSPLPRNP